MHLQSDEYIITIYCFACKKKSKTLQNSPDRNFDVKIEIAALSGLLRSGRSNRWLNTGADRFNIFAVKLFKAAVVQSSTNFFKQRVIKVQIVQHH